MATGEALLTRLSSLFQQDPLIDEVGLLFGIEPNDLSPETAFFLEDHKLGVAFAAGIPLFQAARTQFHQLNALLQQEADEITRNNARRDELLHCTRAILLISADFYTAWNTRKSFVTRGWLDAQDEVLFTNLVLSLHPKSIDTWAYRRWLSAWLCESLTENDLQVFYHQQIEVCSRLAEQKPRNYHAWSFRHWIVSRMPVSLTHKELEDMEQWCRTHVTDHSGWNHRQHTLNELEKRFEESSDVNHSSQNLILAEYKFVSDVMASYPTHEALWCHRRFVMQVLLDQVSRENITNNNLDSMHEMIHWTTGSLSDANLEFAEGAAFTAWDENFKSLSGNVVEWFSVFRVLMHEIVIAWRCGNKFSRRYAAWCLARIRVVLRRQSIAKNPHNEALVVKLGSLASILQEDLVSKDSVLEDLWIRIP